MECACFLWCCYLFCLIICEYIHISYQCIFIVLCCRHDVVIHFGCSYIYLWMFFNFICPYINKWFSYGYKESVIFYVITFMLVHILSKMENVVRHFIVFGNKQNRYFVLQSVTFTCIIYNTHTHPIFLFCFQNRLYLCLKNKWIINNFCFPTRFVIGNLFDAFPL